MESFQIEIWKLKEIFLMENNMGQMDLRLYEVGHKTKNKNYF